MGRYAYAARTRTRSCRFDHIAASAAAIFLKLLKAVADLLTRLARHKHAAVGHTLRGRRMRPRNARGPPGTRSGTRPTHALRRKSSTNSQILEKLLPGFGETSSSRARRAARTSSRSTRSGGGLPRYIDGDLAARLRLRVRASPRGERRRSPRAVASVLWWLNVGTNKKFTPTPYPTTPLDPQPLRTPRSPKFSEDASQESPPPSVGPSAHGRGFLPQFLPRGHILSVSTGLR